MPFVAVGQGLMKHKTLWLLLCTLFILLTPTLVLYDIYIQWRTPIIDFGLDRETGIIYDVPQDSYGDYAGFWVGDKFISVNGIPYEEWGELEIGNIIVEIKREGQILEMELPIIPLAKTNSIPMLSGAFVALAFWGISTALLLRRFQQYEIRIVFLIGQLMAIALLFPMAHPDYWTSPIGIRFLSIIALIFSAPLILQYSISFPIQLGSKNQRRLALIFIYFLALVAMAGWLASHLINFEIGRRFGIFYVLSVVSTALIIMAYVYLRKATPDERRQLRVAVLSTFIAGIPALVFYLLPNFIGIPFRAPVWLIGLLVVLAPLSYLYATIRHNLFGIDQLLNRTLVYIILSLGILLLYLGPFLLIFRYSSGDLLAQTLVAAILTLFIGLTFEWSRTHVQHWVDQLFYGGWYDYPGVVEEVSDALARSTTRQEIYETLTQQIPDLMQLSTCNFWMGNSNATFPQTPPLKARFRFKFQSKVPAQWTVGLHRDGDDLSESDHRILNTLARQAEIALNNVLLIETLRQQLDEIQASREALAQAQRQLLRSREEERARIARDLHDSPIQTLVGLNIQLGLLLSTGAKPESELSEMRAEVRGLLTELRKVCTDLRPPMLDALGLGAALRAYVNEWSAQENLSVQFDAPKDQQLSKLPSEVAVNLFRVAQETLGNISKHAQATAVKIQLLGDENHLQLSIHDNGRGFERPPTLNGLPAQNHFGLVGMRERIELIGGNWSLESTPGEGTRVQVEWNQQSAS
ncbi:MAG TPA: hypothetical protein EYP74_04140 [Anaerolineales bacterium]|nr:hypothetical protein [Anaerolineales bacterium]